MAVEAARAQQRRVEDVAAIGGPHEHDARADREAVEFYQQLVDRLLAFTAGGRLAAPLAADCVDLVDEHDRGGLLPDLAEQVTDPRRADADQ